MSAPIHPIQSPPPFPLSKLLIGLVSGLVLLNLSVFLFSQHRNLPVPIPSEPPSDATDPGPAIDLAQLDMERIHASLLPQWALARVGGEPTSIIPLHEELLEALQAEPTLTEIIHALEKSSEVPAVTTASLVIPLCWAWNQHLDAHSAPWRIRCHMVQREGDHWFYLSSYQVLADVQIQVEEKPQRVPI